MSLARRDFIKMLGLAPLVGMFVRAGVAEARPVLKVRKPTEADWQEAREYRGLVRLAQEPQKLLSIEAITQDCLREWKQKVVMGGYVDRSEHHFRDLVGTGTIRVI